MLTSARAEGSPPGRSGTRVWAAAPGGKPAKWTTLLVTTLRSMAHDCDNYDIFVVIMIYILITNRIIVSR